MLIDGDYPWHRSLVLCGDLRRKRDSTESDDNDDGEGVNNEC